MVDITLHLQHPTSCLLCQLFNLSAFQDENKRSCKFLLVLLNYSLYFSHIFGLTQLILVTVLSVAVIASDATVNRSKLVYYQTLCANGDL